jgi:cell division protein FtsI/penicillin-binding protein 2
MRTTATNFPRLVNRLPSEPARRRRLLTRALPIIALALAAFVAGLVCGSGPDPETEAAERFVSSWARQDFAAMRGELNQRSQSRYTAQELRDLYLDAQETATLRTIDPGQAGEPQDGEVTVPLRVSMVSFGRLERDLVIPFADGGIDWQPYLLFPGLRPGEQLDSEIELGHRAEIRARDGTPLATGPPEARTSPLGSAAIDVTGVVGEAEPADVEKLARQGYPAGTPVGVSGLERAFNRRLAGRTGGRLLAESSDGADRVLAQGEPLPGQAVMTPIDPDIQAAAVAGLAGRAGGVAVLDARTGAVRALAGSAFSAPQPPGSTFKVITTTAALEKDIVDLDDQFPVTDGINVGGRFIANAHDELCGGSFTESFAQSCNAVFAPLGPKIGEEDMVDVAERYGFNSAPTLYDAAATQTTDPPASTIPEDIGTDLDLGVTAIGQGQVLATPLEMASVAQTVAGRGVRMPTPIVSNPDLQADADPVRVTARKVANQLRDLMIGVVAGGTGSAAALPGGIQVAGKTGTAELGPDPDAPKPKPGEDPEQILDAWFAAFAPASKPRLAVGVMLIDAEADGGEVAAPLARDVLAAGLLG